MLLSMGLRVGHDLATKQQQKIKGSVDLVMRMAFFLLVQGTDQEAAGLGTHSPPQLQILSQLHRTLAGSGLQKRK